MRREETKQELPCLHVPHGMAFGVSAILIVQEEAQHKAEIGKRYIHRLNKERDVMKGKQIFIRLENALVFSSRPGFF